MNEISSFDITFDTVIQELTPGKDNNTADRGFTTGSKTWKMNLQHLTVRIENNEK
jgi:hypothetical protein